MYLLHIIELLVHSLSLITATIVILKLMLYDNLRLPTRLCISMIYSSAYLCDGANIYLVFLKFKTGQMVLAYEQIVNLGRINIIPCTTSELTPFRLAIILNEIGAWIYIWGVLLTATSRLLDAQFHIEFYCNFTVFLISPLFLSVIGFSTYYSTSMIMSEDKQQIGECIFCFVQIFGVLALLCTLYINKKKYNKNVGKHDLEKRYKNAYIYKFNRSVLRSLFGEVCCRFLGYFCIIAVTLGATGYPTFGLMSFCYMTIVALGNIIFPWFIILRHMEIKRCFRKHKSGALPLTSHEDMLPIHIVEMLIHMLSMSTASIVILKIQFYDKLGAITKLCISLIYFSPFITDSANIYMIYHRILVNQPLPIYRQIVTEEMTPHRQATFFHEIGTWIYIWGVILTATERLLHSHFNRDFVGTLKVTVLIPFIVVIIGVSSYYCTTLLLSDKYQQIAETIIISCQLFGVAALLYTLYLNQKRYKSGIGECLEDRYTRSYIYRFNRSVLKSLVGEVSCRFLAICFVIPITAGITEGELYGWLAFSYFTLIPIGNIVFPWFIVLRHMKIDWSCGRRQNTAVQDLNGNNLAMVESTEVHFNALSKAWNMKR